MSAKGLKFSEASHRYWLDGKPVPGVTTVLKVLDKPALPKWAATEVATYVAENPAAVEALRSLGTGSMIAALKETPWDKSKRAAQRGTTFHEFAERILAGEEVDVPDEQVGLVEASLSFMDDWHIEPLQTEVAVGDRANWYAGTADLIAKWRHGNESGVGIFDWKTGKRIYPEACYQMNAYGHAEFFGLGGDEQPMDDLGITAAFGVHIRADGYDVYPVKYGSDVYAEFLAIRQVYDNHKRAVGNWREPGSGYVGRAIQSGEVA